MTQMTKIIVHGQPITKKNSQQILVNRATGRPFISPSKQYKAYKQMCEESIDYTGDPIDYPVNLECVYYMGTKRKVDLTNLLQATCDILQDVGVLAGDDNTIIRSVDGSTVKYDKDDPRVEITITKLPS